jgi:drug/metabolite transporter (DMT)-like permease
MKACIRPILPVVRTHRTLTTVKCSSAKVDIAFNSVKWYGWTVVYNIYNKNSLEYFDTSFVTSVQLAFSAAMVFTAPHPPLKITHLITPKYILMLFVLTFGQFFGNHFGNIATGLMNISTVNIVKSTEPILAMGIMFLIFRQKQKTKKILLIFPIMAGICLCNLGDVSYSHIGALMCVLSNVFHIFKIIVSKKYFSEELGLGGISVYAMANIGSIFISVPVIINRLSCQEYTGGLLDLILSCFGYYYNSIAAFDLMTRVSPVTFSLMNIYKRIIITLIFYAMMPQIPTLAVSAGLALSNASLYFYNSC